MLHKQRATVISSAQGDEIYVIWIKGKAYARCRHAFGKKPSNIDRNSDYHDTLIEIASKQVESITR